MSIRAIRILPPLAISRLGSGKEPLDNYTIEDDPDHPLGFRTIKGALTLIVDEKTGAITKTRTPKTVAFKEDDRFKPVAPFLELFAETGKGELVPLTTALLKKEGLSPADVSWRVSVANRKVVRRTNNQNDLVAADTGWFSGHGKQTLKGHCKHFVAASKFIDFGSVRYIRPNDKFPEIRLRFMPAQGLIYGPNVSPADPAIPKSRAIYDKRRDWYRFEVKDDEDAREWQNETLPPSLYAIVPPAPSWLNDNVAISRGYLDDACDGVIEARLEVGSRKLLAAARVTAGPPITAPDTLFVRSLADDLEQVLHGPAIAKDEPEEVTRARALDIVRRALETVRFINVQVMNGNDVDGRNSLTLDSMPEEESADTERAIRPIMAPGSVDTLAILALHEQVFAALKGGSAAWFTGLLRRPDQVGDYTDAGRRKMPALMCGADNSYLALTWRQIDTIRRIADKAPVDPDRPDLPTVDGLPGTTPDRRALTARNLTAQLHYAAKGNPVSSRPVTAISNCIPGLEFDFRAVWRRMFKGLVLREYDNLIVDVDPGLKDRKIKALKGHRLLRVDGVPVMTQMKGPATSDIDGEIILTTEFNPSGLTPLEWSNGLARVLATRQGGRVKCDFSKDASWDVQLPFEKGNHITIAMDVRYFFEAGTAVISRELAMPGELTQGLCSPWQNDYRECSCYYWASSRPDFVNVEPSEMGMAKGDNWFQKEHNGKYVPDDYRDSRLILYDDLFEGWERWLRLQIGGRDSKTGESKA